MRLGKYVGITLGAVVFTALVIFTALDVVKAQQNYNIQQETIRVELSKCEKIGTAMDRDIGIEHSRIIYRCGSELRIR